MPVAVLSLVYVGALPPHPGGGAISCAQILAGLAKAGHRVRALVPVTPAAQGQAESALRGRGIEVTPVTVPYFGVQAFLPDSDEYRDAERRQVRALLPKLIATERPDLILSRERQSVTVGIAELAREHGVPWVLLSRGYPLVAIMNHAYPEALAARALEEYATASLVITPGRHMAEGLHRLGIPRAITIPNAIDLEDFVPRPKATALLGDLGLRASEVIVVLVANLHRRKRPMDVIESAATTTREHASLRYVLVGDGALRSDLETACRSRGLDDCVRFAGWIDYARMPDYINLGDIVVMPSESEGLARVYLEAQACARVLVASDIPPAREVVTEGETGLLFPVGDIDALTTQTLRAASEPDLRALIGGKARRRVRAHSVRDAVARYAEALAGVARGSHS